jgi:hypothetical protein
MQDEQRKKVYVALAKQIGRISRSFLETAVESYRCLSACIEYLAKKGTNTSQDFLYNSTGMLEWLNTVLDFSRQTRKHVQEGRLALMNFLGEKQGFAYLSDLQNKRIDKKSVLLSQLDEMLQAVFELRCPAKEERGPIPVGIPSLI